MLISIGGGVGPPRSVHKLNPGYGRRPVLADFLTHMSQIKNVSTHITQYAKMISAVVFNFLNFYSNLLNEEIAVSIWTMLMVVGMQGNPRPCRSMDNWIQGYWIRWYREMPVSCHSRVVLLLTSVQCLKWLANSWIGKGADGAEV